MTVAELIAALELHPADLEVVDEWQIPISFVTATPYEVFVSAEDPL